MLKTAAALAMFALHAAAWAQATPVGLWKTIDDETKKEKSLVRIVDGGGVLSGKIEKIIDPAKQNDVCEKCSDERKNQPIVGLTIIRNAKASGEDAATWTGGDILDPNNGKVYKLRLKPLDGGKELEVRGYIGPFYRNQTWIRVE
ncbi:MAG: DUF2147 domain-containing protein [Piscinibacter sp.]|uniref:DUF2147 domain-containing protein n=1 Tax=Piscinibacter sp. TaxID=1903157 RepID=UPI00258BCBC2|nr:DUF2147 domain-containing protein [Piscinibacter sp.]MCW5667059.1 DUF2147 domain-containing protein [Piscinibacter sp.]